MSYYIYGFGIKQEMIRVMSLWVKKKFREVVQGYYFKKSFQEWFYLNVYHLVDVSLLLGRDLPVDVHGMMIFVFWLIFYPLPEDIWILLFISLMSVLMVLLKPK